MLTALMLTAGLSEPADAQPAPVVAITQSPGQVSIGESFTVTLTFQNAFSDVGFGPYVDLLLPAMGADVETQNGPCDGINFLSAEANLPLRLPIRSHP